jgi:hypothetical protein
MVARTIQKRRAEARRGLADLCGIGRVAAIAKRIGYLILQREANQNALTAAAAGFDLPPTPPELMVTYRGPLGPLKVEVEADWIRDMLADVSPVQGAAGASASCCGSMTPTPRLCGRLERLRA